MTELAAALTWVDGETWFYNLDNHRHDAQVRRELEAIAAHRPAVIALCEALGNTLPPLPGYTLVEDHSTKSRENIAAYVRDDLPLGVPQWVDLAGTWPRTQTGGTHEARSYLAFPLGRVQTVVAHQPPNNARNVWALQRESVNALTRLMAPWRNETRWGTRSAQQRLVDRLRPRLLVWDANRRSGEGGPGPDALATHIGGSVHGGQRIENAVTRGSIKVTDVHKVVRVGDVVLRSDHGHAIRVRWRVRAYWLAA